MSDPDFDRAPTAPTPPTPPVTPAEGYGPGMQVMPSERAPHLTDYVKILFKRRWLVLSAFFIVAMATAVYTYTAVSIYEARVKLLIEVVEPKYVQFQAEGSVEPGWSTDYYQTQYDLLKSRTLARKTLDTLELWNNMPPKNAPRSFSLMGAARRPFVWVQGLFRKDAPPASGPEAAGRAETARQSRAIDALLDMLVVTPVRDSRIVNLSARSFDPQLATAVANAHAKGFIEQNSELKLESSKEASAWLNDRLSEQRKQVDAAEAALQTYREQHSTIPPEDSQNVTVQKLAQLSSAYTTARMARLAKEVVYNQLQAIGANDAALDAFPAVLTNPTIQSTKAELASFQRAEEELLQNLDINHPKVMAVRASIESTEAKIRAEIKNIVQALRTDFEASQAQEKNLAAALQAQKDEALTMSQEGIQFGTLKREVDSTREIFQSLLRTARETGISTEQRTTNLRIVDIAEPPRGPVSPNRPFNMMLGLLGGLLFGAVLGFVVEYLDDRIDTPEEIKAYLGLPPLSMLPVVRDLGGHDQYPILNGPAWPKLNEAFRTLRTNVIFSSSEQGCRTIAVTSTGPNEGKTLVSANFAMSLAESGLRVLLIDADLRRPMVHQLLALDQEPGLSNVIVGGVKPSEAIKKTSIQGLWVLPAGRVPPNPAELLGSPRFLGLLKSFSEHFDWIVLDTPPVMAVADAAIVAHAVTGVLFVVRAGAVSRYAAQSACEQLDNSRANIIGAVLNRVDLDRHAYYYSQYYRREYSDYYASAPKA